MTLEFLLGWHTRGQGEQQHRLSCMSPGPFSWAGQARCCGAVRTTGRVCTRGEASASSPVCVFPSETTARAERGWQPCGDPAACPQAAARKELL